MPDGTIFELLDEARDLRDRIARSMEGPVADPVDTSAVHRLLTQLTSVQLELDARARHG